MVLFDPQSREHKLICLGAMMAGDALGVGRIRAAKEQLEIEDITPYRTPAEQDAFQRAIMEWGRDLR